MFGFIMLHTTCLVFNPITVDSFAFLFNYRTVGGVSDSIKLPTIILYLSFDVMSLLGPSMVQPVVFCCNVL